MCDTGERKVHLVRGSANTSAAAKATNTQTTSQKNAHSRGLNGNGSSVGMKPTQNKNVDPFATLALERVATKISPVPNLRKKPLPHGVPSSNTLSGEPNPICRSIDYPLAHLPSDYV